MPGRTVDIEWRALTFSITKRGGGTKTILDGCNGYLPGGGLLAVMGPSGSGKTSFINALADRVPKAAGAKLTGEVLIGGTPRVEIASFSHVASYVLQDDSLYPMLTVFETLLLAARLRLPTKVALADKITRVEGLIDELGIRPARDTVIGDDKHKGVSGGERKRTNIGVEIMGDPSLIFLDEPTSGLDAFQALNVMKMLGRLSKERGRTLVVSIHQPRSSIYALFDRLLLFASGTVMYNGLAASAVEHFAAVGHACPVHFNPADFFIDLISVDTQADDKGEADKLRIKALAEEGEKSRRGGSDRKMTDEGGDSSKTAAEADGGGISDWDGMGEMKGGSSCTGRFHSSLGEQFVLLYVRSLRSRVRDKIALLVPIVTSVFFSLIVSALWSNLSLGQRSIQDRTGALFFVTINQAFGGIFGTCNAFPIEKKIVDRERTAGAYAVLPYYVAKLLAELPFAALGPFLFGCIVYFLIGFVNEADNFFIFCGIVIVINATAVAWGMFVSSFSNSVEQATGLAPLVAIVSLLFGGFYINSDNIPDSIEWVQELSFFKYGFKAMCLNEYADLVFENSEGVKCTELMSVAEQSGGADSTGGRWGGAQNSSAGLDCAFVNGKQVLDLLTFSTGSIGECMLYLLFIAAGVHAMAYLCLVRQAQRFQPLEPIPRQGSDVSVVSSTSAV